LCELARELAQLNAKNRERKAQRKKAKERCTQLTEHLEQANAKYVFSSLGRAGPSV